VLEQTLLVELLIVLFLLADVRPKRAFIDAGGRYEVPTPFP